MIPGRSIEVFLAFQLARKTWDAPFLGNGSSGDGGGVYPVDFECYCWGKRGGKELYRSVSGSSPYSEGGALYGLGLIHAIHGEGIKQFLRDNPSSTNVEVIKYGACLGLGLATLGTADEDIYDKIKSVLYTNSAVVGEASGISMGLLMVGTASKKTSEMLVYAHEKQHE
nr:26S proteasome non-ATPase regulatory subunit 1 homolog A [Tanacetum cinerariifolium]